MSQDPNYQKLEQTLWAAADKLRGHLDAAEYKHVVLGLIFLKYISDRFQALYDDLAARADTDYTDPEDRDEYLAENVFWVPADARWETLQGNAKSVQIGIFIDAAMAAIEKENPTLKGVLPQNYGREDLDKRRLGELIDLISTISLVPKSQAFADADAPQSTTKSLAFSGGDVLGRVYEYFLGQFASAEGKKGGEFYTPQSIVKLLVAMLEPYKGRVYDPCCGVGGMFVQSEKFVEEHQGRVGDIAIYGQESNPTTWKLAQMNLAIRGLDGNLGPYAADSFHDDLHPDLKADYILANPPFNISDWGGNLLEKDKRWEYGLPPTGNANFAWIQHMLHHLAPTGRAGFVLANGSMSSGQSGEGDIRRALVEADLVECMVALPPQLFFNTQIPACLWFLARSKQEQRREQVLFIDARGLGEMVDRTRRELTHKEINRIADTFHAWRDQKPGFSKKPGFSYADEPGFCKSATLAEIAAHDYVLTPGRYVGAADVEDDGEPFEEKMERLSSELGEQLKKSRELEQTIVQYLNVLGYETLAE
ncbi:MAG: SAM-dependent DNA methyltransferase [Anaerolineales bacterium]|nr:SAM-dependent DNA methyltransferase [Anaerolineales bacterium]